MGRMKGRERKGRERNHAQRSRVKGEIFFSAAEAQSIKLEELKF